MNRVLANAGLRFRQAAAAGNVESMQFIYLSHQIDILEFGRDTKKTAAHWAAQKGHAEALRLLHNWGDPFTLRDRENHLPAELAQTSECKQVFALIALGNDALRITKQIFPQNFLEDSPPEMKRALIEWRAKTEACMEKKLIEFICHLKTSLCTEFAAAKSQSHLNCPQELIEWLESNYAHLIRIYEHPTLLKFSGRQYVGACGEKSLVSYTYLTSLAKTIFPVDRVAFIESPSNNHAFVVLNLNQALPITAQKAWDLAFVVDAFEERSFFFSQSEAMKAPMTMDALKTITVLYSSREFSLPKTPWKPIKTFQLLQNKRKEMEEKAANRLRHLQAQRVLSSQIAP